MLLLLMLATLIQLSLQQCLTPKDEIRKVRGEAHESLLQSELEFSTDLVRTAANLRPKANLLISPSSVFQASLIAYFISANQTERSLRKTLHLADNYDKLDILGAYNLENYYQKLRAVKSKSYQLSSANRLYIAKDVNAKYCIKVLFPEELQQADFAKNAGGVVKKINQWVDSVTRHVIKDFLSEDSISKGTQLVLVNAAYFKGKWESPFNEKDTYTGKFQLSNGTQVKTLMMSRDRDSIYTIDKELGVEVVELPYVGGDISMLVLLPLEPSPSAVQDLLKRLNGKALHNLVQALAKEYPISKPVNIPKFTVESELDLTAILESLGIGDLFQKSADLSNLAPDLSFSQAMHKAKVNVDEKGTEAAAATSFISDRAFIEPFTADRPFVYTIYDKAANIPLFFGVFNYPEPNKAS